MHKIRYLRNSLPKSLKHASIGTFSGAKRGEFTQLAPTLGNQYEDDAFLRESLRLEIPAEHLKEMEPDLRSFGHQVTFSCYQLK